MCLCPSWNRGCNRYTQLVSQHLHCATPLAAGLAVLPRLTTVFAITLPALVKPLQDASRAALADSAAKGPSPVYPMN